MKIVILDALTLGKDIDLAPITALGECAIYGNISDCDIAEALADADICMTNKKTLNAENLRGCEKLRLISLFATGCNNVDIDYCRKNNIRVRNIPSYCTKSVCQHTFALLLGLMESISYYDDFVKSGKYSKSGLANHLGRPFEEICGKKWGIIGMGNIGREVAKCAESFGAEVVYASISGAAREEKYKRVTLSELLKTSDIISIHSPLNDKTENLINTDTLKMMKKSAYLINVGRGGIVSAKDLVHAVDEGIIRGAAADVFEEEPIGESHPFMKAVHKERFLFTPHIAWGSDEARARCVREAAENAGAFLRGEERNDVW